MSIVLAPPVDTVRAADALKDLVRRARRDRMSEHVSDVRKVFRVDDVARGPALQLLECSARVLDELTIRELDLASRRQQRDETWNTVDDRFGSPFHVANCDSLQGHRGLVRRDLQDERVCS